MIFIAEDLRPMLTAFDNGGSITGATEYAVDETFAYGRKEWRDFFFTDFLGSTLAAADGMPDPSLKDRVADTVYPLPMYAVFESPKNCCYPNRFLL